MSLLVIILCTSLGNLNFKSNSPSYFDKLFCFFLNLDFIYLRVPEIVQKQLIIVSLTEPILLDET